jgi:purine-nucleoside phosphorylase
VSLFQRIDPKSTPNSERKRDKGTAGSLRRNTRTTFETPAEYKLFRIFGADAVGMSTVPEVIVANHCKIKVFGISVITDLGVEGKIVEASHEEVQIAADAAQPKMTTIMRELINRA